MQKHHEPRVVKLFQFETFTEYIVLVMTIDGNVIKKVTSINKETAQEYYNLAEAEYWDGEHCVTMIELTLNDEGELGLKFQEE